MQAIYERRAIKHYDPGHTMTSEEIHTLMEAAMQTPTSFNMQNWRFVVVTDADKKQQLRAASYDQAQVTDASIVIVLCADLLAWKNDPARYWRNAPKPVQDLLVPWMGPFYEGKPELQRDEAMRSVGLAGQTIMLAAKAMDYDSCPMIGFEADKVAQHVNLPDDHVVGMMITVGKAIKPAWPKPGQLDYDEVVISNEF